ncbi:MAG: sigma-70 family RNA polymerase sigma factor [Prevotella sp.]|nr:sigma-70 family RNA polymerase sigma factor [Prevotella sp.]
MGDKLIEHVDLCCRGNSGAFEYIVAEYQQLVYTLAFRLLCNEADAQDATQDTFIKVWQNISQYRRQYKFSTWIYKIAGNVCYDYMRAGCKDSDLDSADTGLLSTTDEEVRLHNKELVELIKKTTGDLSPKQKLVFTLREIEGLDVEEIVLITGLSPAKIKSNLYLARKYIKSKIQNYE